MYVLPAYLWWISFAGAIGAGSATCAVLYGGAVRAGARKRDAILLTAGAVVAIGGWFAASTIIAGQGGYRAQLGKQVPLEPIVIVGFTVALLALSRIPLVRRALSSPRTRTQLILPHVFRIAGISFVIAMLIGELPALFAIPAGLGDIAIGISAPFVHRRLVRGAGRRRALWFNALGIADLVTALVLGGLVGFQIVSVTPSGSALSVLPLVLTPTAAVPLLFVLHLLSLSSLRRPRGKGQRIPVLSSITMTTSAATEPPSMSQPR